jgi:hypothetical protein
MRRTAAEALGRTAGFAWLISDPVETSNTQRRTLPSFLHSAISDGPMQVFFDRASAGMASATLL